MRVILITSRGQAPLPCMLYRCLCKIAKQVNLVTSYFWLVTVYSSINCCLKCGLTATMPTQHSIDSFVDKWVPDPSIILGEGGVVCDDNPCPHRLFSIRHVKSETYLPTYPILFQIDLQSVNVQQISLKEWHELIIIYSFSLWWPIISQKKKCWRFFIILH